MAEPILFTIFGVLALGSAISVIAFKNPIHSALALVLTFFSLAGLFVLLGAYFVAAVQVIVYAGAIMVLFLFVIMLLNLGRLQASRQVNTAKVFAVILGIILAAQAIYIGVNVYNGSAVVKSGQRAATSAGNITAEQLKQIDGYQLNRDFLNRNYVPQVAAGKGDVTTLTAGEANQLIEKLQSGMGSTEGIGAVLFDRFLLPFEVTSFILLAALVGVIALVRREGSSTVV